MANLPPNNDPNVPKNEFIPHQAPAAPVMFAHQWVGWQIPNNNNGWLEEDNNEEPEEDEADEDNNEEPEEDEADEDNNEEIEEEDEEMEDEEEEEIAAEEEAEIIYPYDEVDPNNRPPPASDDESEFAPFVILVVNAANKPVPFVLHFSSTYERGESSSAQVILKDISKVSPLGPVPPTISTAMRHIRKLNDQMRERAEVDKRIVKRIDKNDLCVRMVGSDVINLDCAIRKCQADVSKVISMMENMSLEFERVCNESRRALELVEWEAEVREQYLSKLRIRGRFVDTSTRSFLGPFPDDPYVQARNAAMENDDVEGDDVEDDDDMDDDVVDPTAIAKLVSDEVAKALAANCTTRDTTGAGGLGNVGGAGNAGDPERAQPANDCTFLSFMKCGPTQFHGKTGAIELCRGLKRLKVLLGSVNALRETRSSLLLLPFRVEL
ncbi:hypothetical protein Tco_0873477 [Tanacetum coccineum]|uniref:Uncharacterized protein n=1 Tax=Tanacetum coccineum TaxID=301880 RepID=A0ABQ5BJB1_9ASTR